MFPANIETGQLIYITNQLTGFYMIEILDPVFSWKKYFMKTQFN